MLLCLHWRSLGSGGIAGASLESDGIENEKESHVIKICLETA